MSSLFLVYKSGAGSGKTYTLTSEFLKLALQSGKPWEYKHILAVTFTKKAANEMKTRILEWLLEFANSEDLAENDKAENILNAVNISPEELKERAAKMHEHILHHYSDFSVQTIDSFVHKLIKSFYRDLNLSSDFDVNMDLEEVISEVVAEQLREVGHNSKLSEVMFQYLKSKLDDEKGTRLSHELVSFFKESEQEKAKKALGKVGVSSFEEFSALRKELDQKLKKLRSTLEKDKEELIQFTQLEGTVKTLSNWPKKSFSEFLKYAKTISGFPEKGTIFTAKYQKIGGNYDVDNSRSLTIIENCIPVIDEYIMLEKLRANIYALSLVQDFRVRFKQLKDENNTVMISDFNQMINEVVQNNPTPYIYERLGERYKHYLIDEFQDTSQTQWQNFLPLISHCLAVGNTTMIVGDSKQAIYRWRNGDFRLFAELPSLRNPENSRFIREVEQQLKAAHEPKQLDKNYRSSAEVVEFNNRLFECFKSELSETGLAMYDNYEQGITKAADGYVEFKIWNQEEDTDKDKANWLNSILDTITEAQQNRNFKLGDIAIITRNNKPLSEIASFLQESNIDTSSKEGLLLIKNRDVRLIINVLNALAFPEDEANITRIFSLLEAKSEAVPDVLLNPKVLESYSSGNRTHNRIKIWEYLESKVNKTPEPEEWSRLNAYDAVSALVSYFNLDKASNDYLETLLEITFNEVRAGHRSIQEFIARWNQKHPSEGKGYSISSPDDENSVKLMTIHKSKGLEFPMVIYAQPFTTKRTPKIWYDLSETSSPLEVNYSGEIFKPHQGERFPSIHQQQNHEAEEGFLDDLNLLYVATTRAGQNLIITGIKGSSYLTANKLFEQKFEAEFGVNLFAGEIYTHGEKKPKRKKKEENSAVVTSAIHTPLLSHDWKNRLSYRFSKTALEKETMSSISERSLGISVHAQLAKITKADHAESLLKELTASIEDDEILTGLKTLNSNKTWIHWFMNSLKVWNEKSLIDSKGKEFIPDRVMEFESEIIVVDYKTGAQNDKYAKQVQTYVSLLSELFEKPVKGYLAYIKLGTIEKV